MWKISVLWRHKVYLQLILDKNHPLTDKWSILGGIWNVFCHWQPLPNNTVCGRKKNLFDFIHCQNWPRFHYAKKYYTFYSVVKYGAFSGNFHEIHLTNYPWNLRVRGFHNSFNNLSWMINEMLKHVVKLPNPQPFLIPKIW